MSRRALASLVCVLAACALAPASASAAATPCPLQPQATADGVSGSVILYGGPIANGREWFAPASVCGDVVVSYRGDPAVGCAAMGVCGISGTAGYSGPGASELFAIATGTSARAAVEGSALGLNAASGESALVTRTASDGTTHVCSDGEGPAGNPVQFSGTLSATQLTLLPDDFSLAARCTGPMLQDIASALPSPTVSLERLLRTGGAVDLSGTQSFATHGFSGTVTSTMTATVGKGASNKVSTSSPSGPRLAVALYRVAGLSGSITAQIAGPSDPGACAVLDACGLQSSVTVRANGTSGTASFEALQSSHRRSPAPVLEHTTPILGAIDVAGGLTASASTTWPDQAQPCQDSVGGMGLDALVDVGRGVVTVAVQPVFEDLLRTRCPGPFVGDFPPATGTLRLGTFPQSQIGAPTITAHLSTPTAATSTDGFSATITPNLTLTLKRTSLRFT